MTATRYRMVCTCVTATVHMWVPTWSVRVNALPCVATEVDLASTRDPSRSAPSSAAASGANTGRPSSPDGCRRRVSRVLQLSCCTGADSSLLAV
jgi:hypothetical protein